MHKRKRDTQPHKCSCCRRELKVCNKEPCEEKRILKEDKGKGKEKENEGEKEKRKPLTKKQKQELKDKEWREQNAKLAMSFASTLHTTNLSHTLQEKRKKLRQRKRLKAQKEAEKPKEEKMSLSFLLNNK